jgi:TRAP-type C4-dicarboxylate transport system substrate-binding protein
MSLRKLAGALALAAAVVLNAGAARAADVITLKLSHFVPPVHAFHKWVVKWTEKIEKESGGRLKFEVYPNGQLVGPPNRQFDAARNGITDIAFCLHGVTPGRYPSDGVNLPEMAKRMTELAPKYLAAEHQGLHILFMVMANPIVIYSRVPINSVADFKGKKIRFASITNKQLLDAMGAVPMLIPPPESQDALAKGIADGAGFPHEAGFAYQLAGVAPYAIEPPLASATFAMVMNPAKYNSLPPDLRAILDKEAGVAGAMSFAKDWQDFEAFARDFEITKKGLKIITLPPAEVDKMKALAKPIVEQALDKLEKEGKPAREFFAAYTK